METLKNRDSYRGPAFQTLTLDDVRRIRNSVPGVHLATPMRVKSNMTVRREGHTAAKIMLVGAMGNYSSTWNWPLSEGRDITALDVAENGKVCLLADNIAYTLFNKLSPVGQTVYVNNLPLIVIGRLSHRGFTGVGNGHEIDNRLVLPITTLTSRFNMDHNYFSCLRVEFKES